MTYHVIVASYNCLDKINSCLDTIYHQKYDDFNVCVVDDASPDYRQGELIKDYCSSIGWKFILNEENHGALFSQVSAINLLSPDPEDVIVYLDGDDQFARYDTFDILDSAYTGNILMTYGNYVPVPYDEGCPKPSRYPKQCDLNRDFRNFSKWGIRFNHLRTHKAKLFYNLDLSDFTDENWNWYEVAGDTAVMIPCLEQAGSRYRFINQVLVNYTSDSPLADWRLHAKEIDAAHASIARKAKKDLYE